MKYISFLFSFIFGFISISCQNNNSEYKFINEVLPNLLDIKPKDSVFLKIKTVNLNNMTNNQHLFFSKEFLEAYMKPSLGTNPEKVKALLDETDIEYLANSKSKLHQWNIKRLSYNIVGIRDTKTHFLNFDTIYEISQPVFTKNKKMAFIYYGYTCGVDCGQGTVKVYKLIDDKWLFFVQFPIWIS